VFLVDFFVWSYSAPRTLEPLSDVSPNKIFGAVGLWEPVVHFCSFSSLLTLPLAAIVGLEGPALAWLSGLRMVRSIKITGYYASLKSRLERSGQAVNETISRIVLTLVLAILYASMLACVWFNISCPNRLKMLKGGHDMQDSWVKMDPIIDISDTFSCYTRSLHFIMQVKPFILPYFFCFEIKH